MLSIKGDVLDVNAETVEGPRGSFVSTTISMLSGEGQHARVEHVRVGRDFPTADLPKAGDKACELVVAVSAYAGRNGAGYRLTALSRVRAAGMRAAV